MATGLTGSNVPILSASYKLTTSLQLGSVSTEKELSFTELLLSAECCVKPVAPHGMYYYHAFTEDVA